MDAPVLGPGSGRPHAGLIAAMVVAALGAAMAVVAIRSSEAASRSTTGMGEIAVTEWLPSHLRVRLLLAASDGRPVGTLGEGSLGRHGDGAMNPFDGVSFAPDGGSVIYTQFDEQSETRLARLSLSGEVTPIPGTELARHPVASPDGRTVAFARYRKAKGEPTDPFTELESRYESASTWVIDLSTGGQRQLTPWRNRLKILPTSFSPSGLLLAASRSRNGHRDAIALNLENGGRTILARNATEPAFSADGRRVAFIGFGAGKNRRTSGDGDLYMRWLGKPVPPRQLTGTPRWTEESPSWSPSGSRLLFVRRSRGLPIAVSPSQVMTMNGNGSCVSVLLDGRLGEQSRSFFGPAWRPNSRLGIDDLRCDSSVQPSQG